MDEAAAYPSPVGEVGVPDREEAPVEPAAAEDETRLEDLVVITGFSGAGKSTAMAVFEDAGYFCVDNLPPEMIRALVDLFMHKGSKVKHAAVVCDVRGGEYFDALSEVLDQLAGTGIVKLLFLDADDQTLLNRYKETRRRHPMAPASSIAAGIAAERELLVPIQRRADLVIDTSALKAAHLRRRIADELLPRQVRAKLAVTFQSFGFKHGPARDVDICFDVRFLPNPHYVSELRDLTGLDQTIVDYVGREGKLQTFYSHVIPMLEFLIPEYQSEGKAHLLIGIGCTGGRHRSVAIAEYLRDHFDRDEGIIVEVQHRDIDRGTSA